MSVMFGDLVEFSEEYRSCGAKTVNVRQSIREVQDEAHKLGVCMFSTITTKKVYPLKKPKTGLFVGIDKINTSIFYDYVEHNYGPGNPSYEAYIAHKSDYVEVAEIRCEGVKKSYYAPLENLRKVMKDFARTGYHKCDKMPKDEFAEIQNQGWHIHNMKLPHGEYCLPLSDICPYCKEKLDGN